MQWLTFTRSEWHNDEHAIRRQVNGSGFERGAKRYSLKDVLACDGACSHAQTRISVVGSTHGIGQHCCCIARGCAFLRMLWCVHASREGSSLTRCVCISLSCLRPV